MILSIPNVALANETYTPVLESTVEVPYIDKFKFFIESYGTDTVSINTFEVSNSY